MMIIGDTWRGLMTVFSSGTLDKLSNLPVRAPLRELASLKKSNEDEGACSYTAGELMNMGYFIHGKTVRAVHWVHNQGIH